jgi:hypothetical protein
MIQNQRMPAPRFGAAGLTNHRPKATASKRLQPNLVPGLLGARGAQTTQGRKARTRRAPHGTQLTVHSDSVHGQC